LGIHETGTGQQVAQLRERYIMMMMIMIMMSSWARALSTM